MRDVDNGNGKEDDAGAGTRQPRSLWIGTAGWNVPGPLKDRFPGEGTHLERYSRVLPAAEINSSFYRPHKPETYERWAASAPAGFRFAVKVPRSITHFRRLKDTEALLSEFLDECKHLGPKLGPLLVQLPPSLTWDRQQAGDFFRGLRGMFDGPVACEPRHPTWFTPEADDYLSGLQVARVAADPAVVPQAADPGGWNGLVYYRLHGSPRIYYSAYPAEYLHSLTQRLHALKADGAEVWCIFDNTAEGAAAGDALQVLSGAIKSSEG